MRKLSILFAAIVFCTGCAVSRRSNVDKRKNASQDLVRLTSPAPSQLTQSTALVPETRPSGWNDFSQFLNILNPQAPMKGWYTKKMVGLARPGEPDCSQSILGTPSGSFSSIREFPVQLVRTPHSDSKAPQNCNGIVQTVLYNEIAARYISGSVTLGPRTPPLSKAANLKQLVGKYPDLNFTTNSLIIKGIWEPIKAGRLLVWDPGDPFFTNRTTSYGPIFNGNAGWSTGVSIDATNQSCSSNDYPLSGSIPLSCFVYFPVINPQYVLVGLNIAHKVGENWYWTTFAWTNRPSVIHNRNSQNPSHWSHYVMNSTDTDTDKIGKNTCFNPYLEGTVGNGLVSNCTRCHQFATYVLPINPTQAASQPSFGRPVATGTGINYGSSPIPITEHVVSNYLYPSGGPTLRTDFIWSMVTHLEQ